MVQRDDVTSQRSFMWLMGKWGETLGLSGFPRWSFPSVRDYLVPFSTSPCIPPFTVLCPDFAFDPVTWLG